LMYKVSHEFAKYTSHASQAKTRKMDHKIQPPEMTFGILQSFKKCVMTAFGLWGKRTRSPAI